ncbi:MAG: UDP-N-acetyl-D-galactosamine dehydrogenase [Pseudozobellia sp.]|nr:UDP-N-acetyl-D-galactosamine dehydrogenase [Pseudozobellia sp.]MBG50367.1 UDP-N-acetyl-D-galactosamine dehydrogenase [Pseudozobellia sp.]
MKNVRIGIIGLGYVGLPLACLFSSKYPVIGYDINTERINDLRGGNDYTLEVKQEALKAILIEGTNEGKGLYPSNNLEDLHECNIYIITVPTPIDKMKRPNLRPLFQASKAIGKFLCKDDIVIYESTVYPGVTEEECVPVLEKASNLKFNKDFFVGYSPERINPGDKEHSIEQIVKITSGSTPETSAVIDTLYASVISAGTFKAPSIKIAEAAKVIENTQRDINIAFVNELSKIFNLLKLDTRSVLEAAGTKWNFLPFKPGLVGGHCIGVDPYYLAQKAQEHGYHPEIILAGRRINDSMGDYVATQVIKLMVQKEIKIKGAHILVLGITFKENCPDVRNTKVIDVIKSLEEYGVNLTIVDPWASETQVKKEIGVRLNSSIPDEKYDGIILAVAHSVFSNLNLNSFLKKVGVLFDVKGVLNEPVDGRL